nr:hypothetical protein [Tanacetum cinerariifolium]
KSLLHRLRPGYNRPRHEYSDQDSAISDWTRQDSAISDWTWLSTSLSEQDPTISSQESEMSADVAQSHGGDDGGEDPPPHHVPSGCMGCFANRGTLPEPFKIGKTGQRARSYLDRDPVRLLAFEMRWSTRCSLTHSSWHTLLTGNSFEMRTGVYMLEAMDIYIDDEINRLAREGSSEGTLPVWFESGGASKSGGCGDEEKGADHQDDEDEDGDGDT